MKPYTRAERISMKIQQAITQLLTKKLSDPRIEMATVSQVKMTPDLRLASVYVAVFGDETRVAETLAGFKKSRGFIKKHIAPQLGLKYMPELRFFHDDSFDEAARMDALIESAVRDLPKDTDGDGSSE
jgi:ribosome-binding factor A